jgi:hypothetical protein
MIRRPAPVVLDVGAMVNPDMSDVDALAGLQLLARRLGSSIVLDHAGDDLLAMIECLGLSEILPSRPRSVVEPDREAE